MKGRRYLHLLPSLSRLKPGFFVLDENHDDPKLPKHSTLFGSSLGSFQVMKKRPALLRIYFPIGGALQNT